MHEALHLKRSPQILRDQYGSRNTSSTSDTKNSRGRFLFSHNELGSVIGWQGLDETFVRTPQRADDKRTSFESNAWSRSSLGRVPDWWRRRR